MKTRNMMQVKYSRGSHLGEVRENQPELSLEDVTKRWTGEKREGKLKEHRGVSVHDKEFGLPGYVALGKLAGG